ncbi:unnamed protein product [Didymodactylos carnosus]|uniref:SAYSvFN domain-containing protein n=1 Tax=Didymodactylos carnosus TaxID=1234261 RepID=A0A813SH78_9BILA|nr:unnamed protein product [Didymodactylos carnosus]CAF1100918.1 unnamed protein product [Didymodactylos carnosus]CAF3580634.1 unnamed protein product [Didymodactylos carnosus]CAF3862170.1 unnamed protein product [Didymodactylos carnosus]
MEEKLAEFRKNNHPSSFNSAPSVASCLLSKFHQAIFPSQSHLRRSTPTINVDLQQEEPLESHDSNSSIVVMLLKIVLWLTLFIIFIRLEFGAVYFIISFLYIIWMNLGRRDRSKLSAYSVFNPNFEKIGGTFSGEDYDKQLRHGGGTILRPT